MCVAVWLAPRGRGSTRAVIRRVPQAQHSRELVGSVHILPDDYNRAIRGLGEDADTPARSAFGGGQRKRVHSGGEPYPPLMLPRHMLALLSAELSMRGYALCSSLAVVRLLRAFPSPYKSATVLAYALAALPSLPRCSH